MTTTPQPPTTPPTNPAPSTPPTSPTTPNPTVPTGVFAVLTPCPPDTEFDATSLKGLWVDALKHNGGEPLGEFIYRNLGRNVEVTTSNGAWMQMEDMDVWRIEGPATVVTPAA